MNLNTLEKAVSHQRAIIEPKPTHERCIQAIEHNKIRRTNHHNVG